MSDADKIDKVINYALDQLGEDYVNTPPGAQPPNTWDCSKLVSWAYKQIGVNLTPYTFSMVNEVVRLPGVSPESTNGLQRGDLLFFFEQSAHHVSMYIGDGLIIEAGAPVQTNLIWNSWNSTRFTSAGRVKGIGVIGEGSNQNDSGNSDDPEDTSNQRAVKTTRKINKNAVALSSVHGTPQTGRFAALNVTNETVYLNSDSSLLSGANNGILNIYANVVIPGDQYELKKEVPGGRNSYEITIDSDFIQDPEQADSIASLMSRSFSYQYKAINVKIFGNPLVQLGDIVKFNYYSGKVLSGSNDWYVVTSIKHSFSTGLETSLTIKPLIETAHLEQISLAP